MNRQEAKELLPIIQAFAEGKKIEVRVGNDRWTETDEVYGGRNNDYDYRIKTEPKYRPFKNKKECWEEMQKHQPFGWLKHKTDNVYSFISKIEGVPITPEILKQNDFDDKDLGVIFTKAIDCTTRRSPRRISIIRYPSEWRVFLEYESWHDSVLLRKIQYVHELQQILWVLDMDTNLKI